MFFRNDAGGTKASAARKLNPDDRCRPQLDAALLRMSQLWEAHMERELRSAYPNRRVFLPTFAQFHASLHTQLSGWEANGQYGDQLLGVITMLAGKTDKTVGDCGTHQLAKATRAALKLLNQLIPQAGKQAKALAVEVLEIWADADPGFDQYAAQYGGTGRGPFDLLSRFLRPVLNEWSQDLWKQLRADTPFDLLQCPTLASRLERDSMRSRPDWGISTLSRTGLGVIVHTLCM
jgi:hypothetical protein